MPPIRTDAKAFVVAAAFAAAFLFFCVGNGLIELPDAMRTYDRLLLWLALGAVGYTALFYAGHRLLQRGKIGSRATYAALGALTLAAVYAGFTFVATVYAFRQGVGLAHFIWPAVAGSVFGFLYAYRAGWDYEPTSDALAAAVEQQAGEGLVEAGQDRYFDGPARVRTRMPLMLLAAAGGSLLMGLIRVVLMTGWEVSLLDDAAMPAMIDHAGRSFRAYASVDLIGMSIISIPAMTVMILAGHYAARGLKWTSHGRYLLIGLVVPAALSLVTMFLFLPIALLVTVPNAVAMVFYRNLVGLEPVPVREDIIATNPRDLVGAAHARRRFGRVIGPRA